MFRLDVPARYFTWSRPNASMPIDIAPPVTRARPDARSEGNAERRPTVAPGSAPARALTGSRSARLCPTITIRPDRTLRTYAGQMGHVVYGGGLVDRPDDGSLGAWRVGMGVSTLTAVAPRLG